MTRKPSSEKLVPLTARAADQSTEVFVSDGRFQRIASGVGTVEVNVEPGIYKIRYRSGNQQYDKLVEVSATDPRKVVEGPPVRFRSAVPIEDTKTLREYHAEPAERASRSRPVPHGTRSLLFVFARDLAEADKSEPWTGVSIRDLHGKLVAELGDGECDPQQRYGTFNLELNPGSHRLRVETGGAGTYEMMVTTAEGWQTQVFMLAEDFWSGEDRVRRASLRDTAVFMTRIGEGFHADSQQARLTELARQGLVSGRAVVRPSDLHDMLWAKYENPMLAIYGAHLMLLQQPINHDLLKTVMRNLQNLVGPHPDVLALHLRPGAPTPPKDLDFSIPPMLRDSWDLISRATHRRRIGLVPPGSLTDRVADELIVSRPWLLHRVDKDAGSADADVSVAEASRMLDDLMERALSGQAESMAETIVAKRDAFSTLEQSIASTAIGVELRRTSVTEWGAELEDAEEAVSVAQVMRAQDAPATAVARSTKSLVEKLEHLAPSPGLAYLGSKTMFRRLDLSDLRPVSVVPQALDNQWVPSQMLEEMMERGQSLEDVSDVRDRLVRAEFRRGLVNAEQLVINRAYLYNNRAVFSDFLDDAPERESFKKLLSSDAIVPYLFNEDNPGQQPAKFSADPQGFPAWQQLCREVEVPAVRLSWDDKDNQERTQELLSRRFHSVAGGLYAGNPERYARDLGLSTAQGDDFVRKLTDVAEESLRFFQDQGHVTREHLYKMFVVRPDTNPVEGAFDKQKPFAAELKKLFDLTYTVNLPDALGGYPLTPIDTPPRTVLQEIQRQAPLPETSAEELLDMLRQAAFALVQQGLYLGSFASMSLDDVLDTRTSDEWGQYIASLRGLLASPRDFADEESGAPAVYRNYVNLADRISAKVIKRRGDEIAAKWTPIVEFLVDIGGAILSVVWQDGRAFYTPLGAVAKTFAGGLVPVVARLIIRGVTRTDADLGMSIDIMRRNIRDAEGQWAQLVANVGELPNFELVEEKPIERATSTLNYSEVAA